MVVESSQHETLDLDFVQLGTRQQGVPIILRELMLSDGFDPVSLNHWAIWAAADFNQL
ncbi:unnamed protein product [Schistosoma curassoni]|uniref:Transposase n=1 Tax=Schistosoma curassoni TaxID=6186 RepID=A0A183KXB6_9TREM|nr:unnamed protein product [Schistosoma curassoni]